MCVELLCSAGGRVVIVGGSGVKRNTTMSYTVIDMVGLLFNDFFPQQNLTSHGSETMHLILMLKFW